jgi:hypothetical protein
MVVPEVNPKLIQQGRVNQEQLEVMVGPCHLQVNRVVQSFLGGPVTIVNCQVLPMESSEINWRFRAVPYQPETRPVNEEELAAALAGLENYWN